MEAARHDERVRTQEEREEQTIAIATALGLFVLIVLSATLVVWLLDLDSAQSGTMFGVVAIVAGALAVGNLLIRTRKR
jgi:hypothetical protein